METLDTIVSDLTKIAKENNYEGATVDALIYLMASGIYKNQLNCIATAQELSPSSCTLVNSAIQHSEDKLYSVYRGKNQHILIDYAVSLEDKTVKKYDVCTKIGKYKLVYANDYTFEKSTRFNGKIDLILCTDLIEETLTSSLKKYTRSMSTDLTEDLNLYINGQNMPYARNVELSLATDSFINGTLRTSYLILTDTDYGVICWCHDRLDSSLVFDSNYKYVIKSPKYTEETIEASVIKAIPGFDITETIKKDGIVTVPNLVRDVSPSNIFIESSTSQHSGNVIRSVSDIQNIFLNYFSMQNIVSSKVLFVEANGDQKEKIKIVYLLTDKKQSLAESEVQAFKDYLKVSYYVNQEIVIEKAKSLAISDLENANVEQYQMQTETVQQVTVKLIYDTSLEDTTREIPVNIGSYIELPYDNFTKENYVFIGWREQGTSDKYALTGASVAAKYYPTGNVTLEMVWKPIDENYDYRTVDLYFDQPANSENFYMRIVIFQQENSVLYTIPYEPNTSVFKNKQFSIWVDQTSDTYVKHMQLTGVSIAANSKIIATWNNIVYTVKFIQKASENPNAEPNVSVQQVISGNLCEEPDVPGDLSKLSRIGWYIKGSDDKEYRFDTGTPVHENLDLYAKFIDEPNLHIKVYFDSPLDNTEIHNFIEQYSYEIGEAFSPMRIVTQLTKQFTGISWIDLKSSHKTYELDQNSEKTTYFDFTYSVEFEDIETNK